VRNRVRMLRLPAEPPTCAYAAQVRVIDELVKVLSSADAPASALALVNDAGTYDAATGTGGFNGSLRLECASSRCHTRPADQTPWDR